MASLDQSALKRYARTIRRHLGLIFACVAVTFAVAFVYVQTATKTYTAEAELLINPASQQNTVLFSLPVLHQTGDPTTDVLTAASLITTPQVANDVIASQHLRATAPDVLKQIQAVPLAQSNIVAVEATGSSPAEAQRVANGFARSVITVRTAALHQALALRIPSLRDEVAALPPAQRGGVGTLGDQLSQLKQLAHANDPTITLAAAAVRPTAPTSPRKGLSLAAGLVAGLLIGIGAAFGFDSLDPRLRREEEIRELAPGVPIVARVPRVGRGTARRPLTPAEMPPPAMEQYRMLRASLAMQGPQNGARRHRASSEQTFLVTGSSPSEGKTTSAINLATAMARGGERVILIEADLRRPTIATALGLQNFTGTADVLSGELTLEQSLSDVSFGGAELQVLAAHPYDGADRLMSYAAARRLVDEAKRIADRVVIDSPPLTSVIDALPFALVADQTVVVVRMGHTRANRLSELLELLDRYDRSPSGLVLVGVDHGGPDNYPYFVDERPLPQAQPPTLPASIFLPSGGEPPRRT